MIDLTKPIRRKSDGMRVANVMESIVYYIEPLNESAVTVASRKEFERDFENIPEPRKPREWFVNELDMHLRERGVLHFPDIRVIEWPADAPLPEWPE